MQLSEAESLFAKQKSVQLERGLILLRPVQISVLHMFLKNKSIDILKNICKKRFFPQMKTSITTKKTFAETTQEGLNFRVFC